MWTGSRDGVTRKFLKGATRGCEREGMDGNLKGNYLRLIPGLSYTICRFTYYIHWKLCFLLRLIVYGLVMEWTSLNLGKVKFLSTQRHEGNYKNRIQMIKLFLIIIDLNQSSLQLMKATVLAESSWYFFNFPWTLSAPAMSTDASQVSFALFYSF